MSEQITIKYYKRKIQKFNSIISDFCEEENIPNSFNNALHYKSNKGIGKFWKNLYLAPKLFLANSKAFLNYRETLDNDFANEIMNTDEIFKFQQEAVKSSELHKELKKIMKIDFINY